MEGDAHPPRRSSWSVGYVECSIWRWRGETGGQTHRQLLCRAAEGSLQRLYDGYAGPALDEVSLANSVGNTSLLIYSALMMFECRWVGRLVDVGV